MSGDAQQSTGARTTGYVVGGVRTLLLLEGAGLLLLAVVAFYRLGGSWGVFAAGFFLPDLAFAAYVAGPRAGTAAYNATHWMGLPLLLGIVGTLCSIPVAVLVAVIWFAHIAFDRMVGYGLKYASAFGDTHLGPMGASRSRRP